MALAALCALALTPAIARAVPADVYVDLKVGQEQFSRFAGLEWVEVQDPKIASAEAFESGELLLSGVAPGRTLVLLYGQGRFSVWRIRVDQKPLLGDATAAKWACPGLKAEPTKLEGTVKDEPCRLALRALFETDSYRAESLDLTFELAALQAQLKDLDQGIAQLGLSGNVKTKYLGAGLVLEGELTEQEHHRLLWQLFARSAGRAPLDDQLTIAASPQLPTPNSQPPK